MASQITGSGDTSAVPAETTMDMAAVIALLQQQQRELAVRSVARQLTDAEISELAAHYSTMPQ